MRLCLWLSLAILFTGSTYGAVVEVTDTKSDVIHNDGSFGNQMTQITDVDPQVYVPNMHWATGDSIDIPVGPENAVYCIIEAPNGQTLFNNFGQCRINLDRVTVDHRGAWTMRVASGGTAILQAHSFYVDIQARDGTPIVTTTVLKDSPPEVVMTCSVPSQHQVHACKFRDHRGNIYVASQGVQQIGSNYETNVNSPSCSLRLPSPAISDLGIWRCAVDTSTGTYYGFLTVVCPHLMQNPEIAATIITEPVLEDRSLSFVEGEAVTFNCVANVALRYCYFRARNGTTFSVFPRMPSSHNFEYVGAGLEAGECGIRFNSFSASESGRWSCHAGLLNATAPELRTDVESLVTARMSVRHYYNADERLVVEMQVYNEPVLDYCRFVRMNGEGFTSANAPEGYYVDAMLNRGRCTLYMDDPNILNLHPWTVAAKLAGEEGEILMTTTDNLLILPSQPEEGGSSTSLYWLFVIPLVVIPLAIAFICSRKKSRSWVSRKTSWVRDSFRSTEVIVKKAPADYPREEMDIKPNGGIGV